MAKEKTTVEIKDKGTVIKVTRPTPEEAADEAVRIHTTVKRNE
jgi:hypothetical protein